VSDNALAGNRAWLVNGGNASNDNDIRDGVRRAHTVTAQERQGRTTHAFIVNDQHSKQLARKDGRGLTNRQAAEPTYTVQAGSNKPARAWLEAGRVVAMTPRALARFQSVPDSYQLPESRGLACRVIGNGVPCLLAQRIGESLIAVME
jgi:site-specific DNA-cytosine methylase